jgi:hypothetical protein
MLLTWSAYRTVIKKAITGAFGFGCSMSISLDVYKSIRMIRWYKTLGNAILAVSLFFTNCTTGATAATFTTFILDDVTFGDGGVAQGSFQYDPTSENVTNVNITTTSTSSFSGQHYSSGGQGVERVVRSGIGFHSLRIIQGVGG